MPFHGYIYIVCVEVTCRVFTLKTNKGSKSRTVICPFFFFLIPWKHSIGSVPGCQPSLAPRGKPTKPLQFPWRKLTSNLSMLKNVNLVVKDKKRPLDHKNLLTQHNQSIKSFYFKFKILINHPLITFLFS